MNTFIKATRLLASLFLLVSFTAHAEPDLSLDEAIKLATQNQPLLQSLDDASAASREAAVASGQLPDPRLKIGVINLPITGSDAARFDRDDMTMSTVGVMQEMVPLAKREAETRSLEATAEQYQTEKLATAQSIQRDVAMAWLDVYEAQRKSELYQRMTEEMSAERKILISRVSSGGSQAGEVLRLDSQLSMTNNKRLIAERDERKARAALSRWIGIAASRPLPSEPPIMPSKLSHEAALTEIENHPLIQNAHQTEMVAQSDADRAKAERQQNWSWEVMYGKRRSDLSDMVSFQVAIDLPWDRPNRQDRRTAEKLLLVEKASKLTEDRRRELAAELDSAYADAETADARENEHQQRLIPAAKARLSLAQAAYSSGKQGLTEVWEARRDLIDVELEHLTILTDRQRAAVKLGYLLNDNRLVKENQ